MGSEIYFDGIKFLPAGGAAKVAGYTSDYVGQLCRASKLVSKRVGRAWYVSEESILKHKSENSFTVNKTSFGTVTPSEVPVVSADVILTSDVAKPVLKFPAPSTTDELKKFSSISSDGRTGIEKIKNELLTSKNFSSLLPVSADFFSKLGTLALSSSLVLGIFFVARSDAPTVVSRKIEMAIGDVGNEIEKVISDQASIVASVASFNNVDLFSKSTVNDLLQKVTLHISSIARPVRNFGLSFGQNIIYFSKNSSLIFESVVSDPLTFLFGVGYELNNVVNRSVEKTALTVGSIISDFKIGFAKPGAPFADRLFSVVSNVSNKFVAGVFEFFSNSESSLVGRESFNQPLVVEIAPTVSPTIELIGNNPAEIPLGVLFTDPGAFAVDADGNTLMPSIFSNTVNTAVAGRYEVIWVASDAGRNFATSTRVVNVVDLRDGSNTVTSAVRENI